MLFSHTVMLYSLAPILRFVRCFQGPHPGNIEGQKRSVRTPEGIDGGGGEGWGGVLASEYGGLEPRSARLRFRHRRGGVWTAGKLDSATEAYSADVS